MGRDDELTALASLLRVRRWGALATTEGDGRPYASAVAFVAEPDLSGLLLHLSALAPHSRNLRADARASLLVSEEDNGVGDPQARARLSLLGSANPIPKEGADYTAARALYLARLPDAEPRFGLGDFQLFRFISEEARFVGGFGRARTFGPEALRRAADLKSG